MPEDIREELLEEADRLESLGQGQRGGKCDPQLSGFLSGTSLGKQEDVSVNLKEAREILEQDHYGLEKVKERILQYLAVLQLKKEAEDPSCCWRGRPEPARPVWAKVLPGPWAESISA